MEENILELLEGIDLDSLGEINDIEIDTRFDRSLAEDDIDSIVELSPWNQLKSESDKQFKAFKYFIALAIDEWEPTEISKFVKIDEEEIETWSREYSWKSRRLAHLKYQEWLKRKKEELEHIDSIAKFRNTQINLLQNTGNATINLIEKLGQRINELDPSEIKATDIPKFVTAVAQFIDLSTEAEARALTLNELLALYQDELDSQTIRKHINLAHGMVLRENGKSTA